jgi:tyrocidine synthetase-3
VWQFLSGLLTGGRTVIFDREAVLDPGRLLAVLRQERISILELVPSLINAFLETVSRESDKDKELKHLRWLVATGEVLTPSLARQWYRHYPRKALLNAYGPTEASDDITHYRVEPPAVDSQNPVPIGKPIQNTHVYILDNNLLLCPIGVRGEICTSGLGVGPGYHRDPDKTKAAFVPNPYADMIGDNDYATLYKTGDIGFFREDGHIDFMGRLDHQVKIRGYRIELGEIENRLLNYPTIKEAVVMVKNAGDDKYLCAYIVSEEGLDSAGLKHQLLNELPDYMVPSYYVFLDKIPLTTSGKINRESLPEPQYSKSGEYTPPRDEIEEKLAEIWADILFMEKSLIGIDSNFFESGGHSLKAAQMVSRIHKVFNVRVPLPEIFRTPSIRGLSEYIKSADRQHFTPIRPMEEKEYYALSSPQARFYLLQQLNRENTTYNMSLPMPLDPSSREEPMEMIFKQLIRRHESLRTSFKLIKNEPHQLIHREVDFKMDYLQGPAKHKAKIIEEYIKPFDLSIPPLFRVALIKTGSEKTLVVDMHHIISDGISLRVLTKEFMALYEEQQLTPLFLQYKDYASWQKHLIEAGIYKKMEKFWLDTLENFQLTKLPEDRTAHSDSPRGEIKTALIGKDTYLNIEEFCQKYTLTKFSFMFSIFTFVLAKEIDSHDISLAAPVANREHSDLENMIGVFLNVIMLRANIDKGDTVLNNLLKINRNVVDALENSTYPYEELFYRVKNKYHLTNDELFTILFNYLPAEEEETAPDSGSRLTDAPDLPLEITPKYNVTVYLADDRQQMDVIIVYNKHLYHRKRMERIAGNYLRLIETVLADEHIPIDALNYEDEASISSLAELAGEFDTEDLW